jgi:hypothetical protein
VSRPWTWRPPARTSAAAARASTYKNAYDYNSEYSGSTKHPAPVCRGGYHELPFGKGRSSANSSKLADYVIGGWQFNMITTIAAGFPMSVINPLNPLNAAAGAAARRPNSNGTDPTWVHLRRNWMRT